jgi:hypothetical protein
LQPAGRLTGQDGKDHDVNDDRQLVQQMLAGDERAFVTFFETYFPRIYSWAISAARQRCSPGCARSAGARSPTRCARSVVTRRK